MAQTWELLVNKSDLHQTRINTGELPEAPLESGQVRFAIDSYAMTANNATYAVMGAAMQYWDFFPAEEGWGIVPVWGFADVTTSTVAGIEVGDRYYGYWPTATHLIVEPTKVTQRGFTDGAAHRSHLAAVYNNYSKTASDPGYVADLENIQSLLRPLFTTSFFIDDFFADNEFYGADSVLIASASSKTAFALAFCLHQRGVAAIGLTSPSNVEFVEGLGWYDEVVTYDSLSAENPSVLQGDVVYVDMSGNAEVRAAVHNGASGLRFDLMVGATHWDATGGGTSLPGPTPEMFFAPSQIAKRAAEWGGAGVDERVAASWEPFVAAVASLLEVEEQQGASASEAAYLAVLDGTADPSVGLIIRT